MKGGCPPLVRKFYRSLTFLAGHIYAPLMNLPPYFISHKYQRITGTGFALAIALMLLPGGVAAAETTGEFSKGIIDIGIVVREADRTAAFLTNAIGFTEVKGFPVTVELGRKLGMIDGYPTDVRVFTLTEGEQATRMKVLSFPKAKTAAPDQKFIHSAFGIRYLTLYVKDMNRALERLKTAKVPLLGETPFDLGGGTFIAVVQDPDGNFVELIGPKKN
jgi:lactoylglutathione lyase